MHNEIKTYELTNLKGANTDFIIKDIGYIYDKFNGISDAPHRHDYYTLIIVDEGQGNHIIDFKEFDIRNHSLHFVYPGQVHQFINPLRPNGWVINFSEDFLVKNHISHSLINQVYLFNTYGDSPPLLLREEEFETIKQHVTQLIKYQELNSPLRYEALGAVLKLILIQATSVCTSHTNDLPENTNSVSHLISNFKKLIDEHYAVHHKVADYAEMLAVSSNYLNKYVKMQTHKSAKEFIQEKIIIEAKRELLFSNDNNKELAYKLGFEEPAHFSNFFKKHTGVTPGNFKTMSRQLQD